MKTKFLVLTTIFLLTAGFSMAAPSLNDASVDKNISTVAGNTDFSIISFRYNGDASGRTADPVALGVEIGDEEVSHEMFDVTGSLTVGDNSYDLVCGGEYSDISGGWEISEFYANSIPTDTSSNQWYCFAQDSYWVVPTVANVESELRVNITPNVALAPGNYDVNYSFHSFEGVPEFDPRGETDENRSLRFDEIDLEITADTGSEFSVVSYSDIFVNSKMPAGEEYKLFYTRINSIDEENFGIKMGYNQQKVEEENLENPTLYRCIPVDGDCIWSEVEDQETENGNIKADLSYSSLYGLFSSVKTQGSSDSSTGSSSGDSSSSSTSSFGGTSIDTTGSDELDNETNNTENISSDNESSDESSEPETMPHDIRLEFDNETDIGENVTVNAYVDEERREGIEIFLNGQLQGETDETGSLSFTPQEEGRLSVAGAYNNSYASKNLNIVQNSEGPTGQAFGSPSGLAASFLTVILIVAVYWKREALAQISSSVRAQYF